MNVQRIGGGGRDRTRADAVLETAALSLSYTPLGMRRPKSWSLGHESNVRYLIHIQAF
jgi:hypothetical protein